MGAVNINSLKTGSLKVEQPIEQQFQELNGIYGSSIVSLYHYNDIQQLTVQ